MLGGVLEPEVRGRLIVVVVQKSLEPVRAIGLLRLLQESGRLLSHLTPDDRVAILSFDSHLKIWLDFTGDLNHARAVLAEDVMFRKPARIEPTPGLSLVSGLSQDLGRQTYTIEKALRLLGNALEPLPGSKSVVLVGYGFGRLTVALGAFGATLDREYEDAREALHAARAAVFCLDVTDADYHTFEHGLQTVAADTGGFFARTHLFAQRAVDRVANALAGHYVLFTENLTWTLGPTVSRYGWSDRRDPSSRAEPMSTDARTATRLRSRYVVATRRRAARERTITGNAAWMFKEEMVAQEIAGAPRIVLIQNWVEELTRLVPTDP